jgi:hypothetical protein
MEEEEEDETELTDEDVADAAVSRLLATVVLVLVDWADVADRPATARAAVLLPPTGPGRSMGRGCSPSDPDDAADETESSDPAIIFHAVFPLSLHDLHFRRRDL